MSDQEIYQIASRLAAENKVPSTALIKARLSKSLPLAQIIKGLQRWQANPSLGEEVINEEPNKDLENHLAINVSDDIQAYVESKIAHAVAPLEEKIKALEAKLANLNNK